MDDIESVARQMGMKPSEVLEVVQVDGGQLVRTHDGQWTLVRDDGTCVASAAPGATLERDAGVVEPVEQPKPAAKRRGRS